MGLTKKGSSTIIGQRWWKKSKCSKISSCSCY